MATKKASSTLVVPIVGVTPLIVSRFCEEVVKAKNPEARYEAAFHRLKDGRAGMIVVAFKEATVGGARFYTDVNMEKIKSLFFLGEPGNDGRMMVPIDGEPNMREDEVRVQGHTIMRYRPQFCSGKRT